MAKARKNIVVAKETVFFASQGDPKGEVHVVNKWAEAAMMSSLLLAAIARSGISLDVLDLPGAAKSIKDHVEANAAIGVPMYPGASMIHAAVETIRSTRAYLDTQHVQAVEALQAAQQAGQGAQPESPSLH